MGVKGRRLPFVRREEFKQPFGTQIDEHILQYIDAENILITVGDVVSLAARKNGVTPDLSIYDGMTERRAMTEFAELVRDAGEEEVVVENPAGEITCGMFDAVRNALAGKTKLIRVIGEEDLAVLPCMLLAPEGTRIIYGLPGIGMTMVTTTNDIRERAEELWNQMEEFE